MNIVSKHNTTIHYVSGRELEEFVNQYFDKDIDLLGMGEIGGDDSEGYLVFTTSKPDADDLADLQDPARTDFYKHHLITAVNYLVERTVLSIGTYIVTYTWG